MINGVDLKKENLAWSSLCGVARGISVHTLIYPLEVIKIRLQCSQDNTNSLRIALIMLRQERIWVFYKGLAPQLLKTGIKQIWCWPMITEMPFILKRCRIDNFWQQALTGLSIATIDAAISTPLERAKIVSAISGTNKFCFRNAYRDGWRGFIAHWKKLSMNWVVFLTAQKHLRDQSSGVFGQPLSFLELTKIGVQVALIVSLVSAPFDIANTLKQAQNLTPLQFFNRQRIFKLYRGWPLSAISLVIHNIASVTLIEKLRNF